MRKNLIASASLALLCMSQFAHADMTLAEQHKALGSQTYMRSFMNKIYLQAGVGGMQYKKFSPGGRSKYNQAPKSTPVYGIGAGYKFDNRNVLTRVDINFQYSRAKYRGTPAAGIISKQKIDSFAAFINGYYDVCFAKAQRFVPYLTAGLGMSRNKAGKLTLGTPSATGRTINSFAWNAGAGFKFNFNERVAIDLGYRYMDLGTTKSDGTYGDKQKVRGNQGIGSLIYSF